MNTGRDTNPFSSHLVDPTRGGYIFGSDGAASSLDAVLNLLEQHRWRGELVGVKGAGKSTLLTDICSAMRLRDMGVARWQCNDRHRSLPCGWHHDIRKHDVIAIDGAERLWPWLLWFVRALTSMRGKGLVITTHRRFGLGAHLSISTSPATLAKKVQSLTGRPVSTTDMESRLHQHRGNAREVLLDLYMEHER